MVAPHPFTAFPMRASLAATLAALLVTASPVLAQTSTDQTSTDQTAQTDQAASQAAPADLEVRREAARSYIASAPQQQMLDQLLSADVLTAQLKAQFPQLAAEQIEVISRVGSETMAEVRPQMEAAMVDAAAQTFTVEEIKALDAFYRTPEGTAVMSKMQPFMQSAMRSMAPAMQQAQAAIAQRVQQELARGAGDGAPQQPAAQPATQPGQTQSDETKPADQ